MPGILSSGHSLFSLQMCLFIITKMFINFPHPLQIWRSANIISISPPSQLLLKQRHRQFSVYQICLGQKFQLITCFNHFFHPFLYSFSPYLFGFSYIPSFCPEGNQCVQAKGPSLYAMWHWEYRHMCSWYYNTQLEIWPVIS